MHFIGALWQKRTNSARVLPAAQKNKQLSCDAFKYAFRTFSARAKTSPADRSGRPGPARWAVWSSDRPEASHALPPCEWSAPQTARKDWVAPQAASRAPHGPVAVH